MKSSTYRRTQTNAGGSLSSLLNTRGYVARSDHIGSSITTTQTTATARTSKEKGKRVALSLPGPSISSSPALTEPNARTCTIRKSVRPATTKNKSSQLTSNTSGKLAASCKIHFGMPDAIENKRNVLKAAASKIINEKSLQGRITKDLAGHIRAEEDTYHDHLPKPVGARCQLCKLDLAFLSRTREYFLAKDLPPVAVLPCGHCYHAICSEDFFGAVEPPCITCLGCS